MSASEEVKHSRIELFCMADVETVRGALDDHQAGVAECLMRALGRTFQRYCGVAVAVDHQSRHGDRREIVTVKRSRFDAASF